MRAVFIFVGTSLIDRFWWLLIVFGVILVVSGIKVVRHRDDEGAHGHDRAVRLLGRVLPVRSKLDGQRFVVRDAGRLVATPLLAALVVVELTDVVFAVDSVPAILAVSREPFLVFSSNAFAILGLRALYFLLGDAKQRFHYLSHALGAILVFVGLKMIASRWWHLPTAISLGVIVIAGIGRCSMTCSPPTGATGPSSTIRAWRAPFDVATLVLHTALHQRLVTEDLAHPYAVTEVLVEQDEAPRQNGGRP